MKVLLDTNVLAAALGTRGLCADVLREVLARHELLSCRQVEVELGRTLTGKFGVPRDVAREALGLLRECATRVPEEPLRDLPLRDRGDVAVVSAAANAGADVLVTGDGEIRGLRTVGGTEVLSPRGFWERVRAEG